mmetsp:Transcript_19591/g.38824  ORF Transcript_19591/g.38824 Transcript_19591/m.38824 type:complete len:121 (+) Transcript_19591:407-769(+)
MAALVQEGRTEVDTHPTTALHFPRRDENTALRRLASNKAATQSTHAPTLVEGEEVSSGFDAAAAAAAVTKGTLTQAPSHTATLIPLLQPLGKPGHTSDKRSDTQPAGSSSEYSTPFTTNL